MAHDRLQTGHRHVEHRPVDVQIHPEQPAARQQHGVRVLAEQKTRSQGGVLERTGAHHEGLTITAVARMADDRQEQVQERPPRNRFVRTPVFLPDLPLAACGSAVEPEAKLRSQIQAELACAELRREGQRLPGRAAAVIIGNVLDADAEQRSDGHAVAGAFAFRVCALLRHADAGTGGTQHQGSEHDPDGVGASGEDPSSV